ncbi:MAG: class I SAM-dependent methyltransferase [Saprospiraceae bacterium]
MNTDMIRYYRERAPEYEAVYARPEDQPDLDRMAAIFQAIFLEKNVLEIACGTGYWTEYVAQTARTVCATDINQSVLDIAVAKSYPRGNVRFRVEDIFERHPGEHFDALLGGFIWSHILLERLDEFLDRALDRVVPGGLVVFADSQFLPNRSTPTSHTDTAGNNFQTRRLLDGSEHLVLKNFPSPEFLREKLPRAKVLELEHFWVALAVRPA